MSLALLGRIHRLADYAKALWCNRSVRYLLLSGVMSIAAIAFGTAIMVVNFRNRALADSERELKNTALILAEQIDRSFQSLELVQVQIVEKLRSLGVASSGDYARHIASQDVHLMIKTSISGMAQIAAITLIDADGNLMDSSRNGPLPTANLADRDYFHALKSDAQLASFIGLPVRNRITDAWTLFLARKLTGSNGEFLGVVLGAIELSYFEGLFGSIELGTGSSTALYRGDGILLARYPRIEGTIGKYFKTPIGALGKSAWGTARFIGQMGGKDRLLAAHRLAHFPLFVSVALDADIVLAEWRNQTRLLLGAGSLAAVMGTGMILLIVGHLSQEQKLSTQRLALESQRITHLVHYDPLTDLPNRVLFREQLEQALKWVRRDEQVAVLFLDLDHFQTVNDSLGHPIGDALLKAVAIRLHSCLIETEIISRLGGDEFAIIQTAIIVPADVTDLITRIYTALEKPFDFNGHKILAKTSIGIAIAPGDGIDPDEMLKNADLAMYGAKAGGRGTYRFFEPSMDARVKARLALEANLRQAILHSEFELHYQPVVNLQDNRISGCEALLRWQHPERGMISPADFIPIAEATGLILPIGEWVLRTACAQAESWPDDIKIAVNVSTVQFKSGALLPLVVNALALSGLSAERLELEITEAVLIHDDVVALAILHQLREVGVRIAMDDFGTGYSSLSYLQRFPFDKIKIDQSFINGVEDSASQQSIVQAVITIAKARNMTTTAEGVETEPQRAALRGLGCTEMQGYLYSQPISAAEVTELILSDRKIGSLVASQTSRIVL